MSLLDQTKNSSVGYYADEKHDATQGTQQLVDENASRSSKR